MKFSEKTFLQNNPGKVQSITFLIAVILVIATSCISGPVTGGDNMGNQPLKNNPPDLSGSKLVIEDINGEDLYPGDEILIKLILKNNSDKALEDIAAIITDDSIPLILEDFTGLEVKNLDPGGIIEMEVRAWIADGIEKDFEGKITIEIYSKDNSVSSISSSMDILGVSEYGRGLIPIIGLHAIEEVIGQPIELSTTNFDILCSTLKDFGYQTITFNDLLKYIDHGRVLPEKSVIITSDDGYQDNYTQAFPILKKYGFVMTIFLVTSVIAEDDGSRMPNTVFNERTDVSHPMLVWPEIIEMDEYGCEFLSHTVNHIRLGLVDDKEALEELIGSRLEIEERLGKDVDFFAWPFDNYSEDKWPLIEEAGYRGAVRYWGGIEDLNTLELHNIRRMEFNSYVSPSQYAGYLKLFNLDIDSNIQKTEISTGEEFEVEYIIRNNEDIDITITSLELELSDNLELSSVLEDGDINQFPALSEGIFMWVGDGYIIKTGKEIKLKVLLKSFEDGSSGIQFRATALGSYVEAEDIEINITGQ